jgi:class 3 adenylate cyclase
MDSSQGYVVVNPGSGEAYRIELEDGKVLEIGRKANPSSQKRLVLPVPEVSGNHAEIRQAPEGWTIRDLGSTNGTRLNGDWISPGQEYQLKNGDIIKIAQVDLEVNLPNDNGAAQRRFQASEDEHEKTQFHIKLINATILVGDIRSFTSLMEAYSSQPERVMHAAQRVFQHLADEIKRQHGQVEKVAGDAIMAYWQGSDSPQSQHNMCAYQACYTALQMKNLVNQIAQRPDAWPFPEHPLEVDVALATGPVAAGVLGAAKANPALLGDTANLAFRLEKLIGADRPGDIIMDGSTYELIKEHFAVESLGPYTVKGRQKPVDVYRLVSLLG